MVDIIGRAKVVVDSAIDRSSLDTTGSKVGAGLKRGAVVGVAALGSLAVAGVKAFQAFEEAEAQSRKLNAVLNNMGQGQATEGVEKLADELMRLTGIDDEVIKGGQTILATFDALAASAGETGGTFDRATRAAVDMSSVFGSVETASRTLGKALSDPEKAAALLRRSNVILNEEQQTLIDNFIAAGDAAGAQDVILQALEDRYAGTAEAAATESAKIATAWGEVQESVGLALTTLTGGEVSSFSESLLAMADAIEKLAESKGWKETGKRLRDINKDVKNNDTFLGLWADSNREAGKSLLNLLDNVTSSAPKFRDRFSDHSRIWKDWGRLVGGVIDNVIDGIKDYIKWHARIGDPITGDDVPDAPDISQPRETRAGGGRTRGLTLVGESGPELVQFGSGGGYVHNNSETRRMVSGGNTVITNYNLYGPESLSQARRDNDWDQKYGTRFGAATQAAAL